MRLWLGIGILAVCVVAIVSLVFSGEKKRDEAAFQATLAAYRTALQTGTSRAQVEDYLRQQGVSFSQGCGTPQSVCDRVDLGEQPRNLFCQPWTVYADFQFNRMDASGAAGTEHLKSIDLHKEGVCF